MLGRKRLKRKNTAGHRACDRGNRLRSQFGLVHVIVQEPDTDDDEGNRPTVFQDGTQRQGHDRGRKQAHRRIFRPGGGVHIVPPPEPGKGNRTPQKEERADESRR